MVDFLHLLWERLPIVGAGVAFLGATAWLLVSNFESRVHRALALLFCLEAVDRGLFLFASAPGDLAFRMASYLWVAIPFAAMNFALVYHESYGARPPRRPRSYRVLRGFLLLAALAFVFALTQNPRLFYAGGGDVGPLWFFSGLENLLAAALALVFAREFGLAHLPIIRRGLSLVAFGFALNPLFGSSFIMAFSLPFLGDPAFRFTADQYAESAAVVMAVGAAAILFYHRRRNDADASGPARWHVPVMALALFTGAALGAWGAFVTDAMYATWLSLIGLLDFVWEAATPILLMYAVLRYRFLGADAAAKITVRRGTVGAAFLAVFFVASETPQALLANGVPGIDPSWGAYAGLAAAGILVFFMHPLMRLGERVSDAALPNARPLADMASKERSALYLEQASLAWRDGVLNRKERLFLDQLRRQLGIPVALAAEMEGEAFRSLNLAPDQRGASPRRARQR